MSIAILFFLLCVITSGMLFRKVLFFNTPFYFGVYRVSINFFWGVTFIILLLQLFQLLGLPLNKQILRIILIIPLVMVLAYWVYHLLICKNWSGKWLQNGLFPFKAWNYQQQILLVIILLQLMMLFLMVINLPLLGWDGWGAWLVKSKVWYVKGLHVTFTTVIEWYQHASSYSNLSANYPDGFSLIHYALSLFSGWSEREIKIFTWWAFVFFIVCFYRSMSLAIDSRTFKLYVCLILACIPMFRYHIYSGGYVDLWLAVYILLSLSAAQYYVVKPNRVNFIRLLVLLSMLVALKLEGIVWMLLFIMSFFIISISARNRWLLALLCLLVALIWYLSGGFGMETPLGYMQLTPDLFQFGHYVSYEFLFHDSTAAMFVALFLSRNWFVIWYFLPLVLILMWLYRKESLVNIASVFFLLGLLFIFFLFYLTGASEWADNFTSVNRIFIHITPVYLFLLAILFYRQWLKKKC